MKLFVSKTSPFARKVLVVAHETGLVSAIDTTWVVTTPLEPNAGVAAANPLAKIPALLLDDGSTLVDSRVICEYLDNRHQQRRVFPAQGPAWQKAATRQAMADGALEAAIVVQYERMFRPKELHWPTWLDAQTKKVLAALDAFEAQAPSFGPEFDIGQIALACALGWLEFRATVGDIRGSRPALFAWYERVRSRPSMQATEPRA